MHTKHYITERMKMLTHQAFQNGPQTKEIDLFMDNSTLFFILADELQIVHYITAIVFQEYHNTQLYWQPFNFSSCQHNMKII